MEKFLRQLNKSALSKRSNQWINIITLFLLIFIAYLFFNQSKVVNSFLYHPEKMYVHKYCAGDEELLIEIAGHSNNLKGHYLVIGYITSERDGKRVAEFRHDALSQGVGEGYDFAFTFSRVISGNLLKAGESYIYTHGADALIGENWRHADNV